MKFMNNFKRILCVLLCLVMVGGVLLSTASAADDGEETMSVLRFVDTYASGTKITAEMIETIEMPVTDVPLNAITDIAKVENKYLNTKVYKGEFVFAGKLSATAPSENTEVEMPDYILVNGYVEMGKDVAAGLQKLIDENPGRTLYFPDGTYLLSKPLTISGDPAKKVSLQFSDYAVLKVNPSWSGGSKAMITIGADTPNATTSTSAYIMGGIFDAYGKTTAISVEGGRDIFISGVTINNATCGINIASGKAYTDVENVHIYGKAKASSIGVTVAGEGNTFTSLRITNVQTGISVSGAYNTMRACYVYSNDDNSDGIAYQDTSSAGNNFDNCISTNFGVGFSMNEATKSVYSSCSVLWSQRPTKQVGFKVNGKLNSIIKTCVVKGTFSSVSSSAYLECSDGGSGTVLYPILILNKNLTDANNIKNLGGGGRKILR